MSVSRLPTIPAQELHRVLTETGHWRFRVEVRRPTESAWTDLTTIAGGDWVLGIDAPGGTPDRPALAFTLRFFAHADGRSLAPGISQDPMNRDAALAFAPLIYPGNYVRVWAANDTEFDALDGPDRLWLRGRFKRPAWPGDDIEAEVVTPDGQLDRIWVEDEVERGAEDPGTPLETEIQWYLDTYAPEFGTLRVVPDAEDNGPELGVGPYVTEVEAVGPQLRAWAKEIAWDFRHVWDESAGDEVPTLYLPPRDKVTPDLYLEPQHILAVPQLETDDEHVRNRFRLEYWNRAAGEVLSVEDTVPDSETQFGPRFMRLALAEGDPVDNDTAATRLVGYMVSDLPEPPTTKRLRIPFCPWIGLHDMIRVPADDARFDYETDWSVVGVSHTVTADDQYTELGLRGGSPVGQYYAWFNRRRAEVGAAQAEAEALGISVQPDPSQVATLGVLDVIVADPLSRVTSIQAQTKQGAAAWSGVWADGAGTSVFGTDVEHARQFSVVIDEKHNSQIKWRVGFTGQDGETYHLGGSHTYDIDTTPHVRESSLTLTPEGYPVVSARWDEDADGVLVTLDEDATEAVSPRLPTEADFDVTLSAENTDVRSLSIQIGPGEWMGARYRPYRGSGASIVYGPDAIRRANRPLGSGIVMQYAQDSAGTGATYVFDPALHTWARHSDDGGDSWTEWYKFVGEDGASAEGRYVDYIFRVVAIGTTPATPTGDAPAGWSDAPPTYDVSTHALWLSRADRDGATDALLTTWSAPVRITGAKGPTGPTGPEGPQGPIGLGSVMRVSTTESGNVGTLTLTPIDGAVWDRLLFNTKVGGGSSWTGWATHFGGPPYEKTVALVAGHTSRIAYRVYGDATTIVQENEIPFDLGTVANVTGLSATNIDDENARIVALVDTDTRTGINGVEWRTISGAWNWATVSSDLVAIFEAPRLDVVRTIDVRAYNAAGTPGPIRKIQLDPITVATAGEPGLASIALTVIAAGSDDQYIVNLGYEGGVDGADHAVDIDVYGDGTRKGGIAAHDPEDGAFITYSPSLGLGAEYYATATLYRISDDAVLDSLQTMMVARS